MLKFLGTHKSVALRRISARGGGAPTLRTGILHRDFAALARRAKFRVIRGGGKGGEVDYSLGALHNL